MTAVALIPSRGRPAQLMRLLEQIEHTTAGRVQTVVCVDEDDPRRLDYRRGLEGSQWPLRAALHMGLRRSLSEWTNWAAQFARGWLGEAVTHLVSMGDDHWPATQDWDLLLAEAIHDTLDGPGWAYGDDGVKGAMLPTAWMQSVELFDALGWVMEPHLEHMYVDNVVLELGRAAQRITYAPYVTIEHRHPEAARTLGTTVAGAWDDTYAATNRGEVFEADRAAFARWRHERLAVDLDRVRSLHHTTA